MVILSEILWLQVTPAPMRTYGPMVDGRAPFRSIILECVSILFIFAILR